MGFTKFLSHWKPGLRAAQLSCLALLSAGWTNQLRPPADSMPREEMLEQSRKMTALYDAAIAENQDRVSINLDLSDETQYRFVTRRLKASGKNERNSPELFSKLNLLRERAVARKQTPSTSDFQTANTLWCDHYLLMNPPSGGGGPTMTYEPYVRVSCHGGANYVYADIVAYNVNTAETDSQLVASNSGEEYEGGTEFISVGTSATLNVTEGRLLRLESLALAVDDVSGRDVSSYTVARTSISMNETGSFTLIHPREIVQNTLAEVLMCQLRGGSDCDYAVAGYNSAGQLVAYPPTPTGVAAARADAPGTLNPNDYWAFGQPFNAQRLYVPIRVDIVAGVRNYLQCTVDHYTYAKVKMHTGEGDSCANSVDFLSKLPVGKYQATFNYLSDVSYNLNGNNTTGCPTSLILNKSTVFAFVVIGKAKCRNPDGTYSLFPFTKTQTIDGRNLKQRKIFYRNSCMAEGTQVQLEDGRVVPVEQVKQGDKVRSGASDTVLTVTDVARGNELAPFVQLRDSAGHEVTLTEMHPVIKANGEVVAAQTLKVKDTVRTDKGTATLTSVTRVPVEGKRVFNLKLGTDAELATVGKQGRTLFAGGFLVGDMSMQVELERPEQKPVDVLARLPKAWHQDFKNAQLKQ